MVKLISTGIAAGCIGGVFLGISLKLLQHLTGKKVYTLLLNVDFIPLFSNVALPERIEFSLHLLTAAAIGIVYAAVIVYKQIHSNCRQLVFSVILTIPAALLYYPLTILAIKDTPSVTDRFAFACWIAGHLIFAASLHGGFRLLTKLLKNP